MHTTFARNGYDHHQITREGDIAIFRRRRTGGQHEHYEVVRIREHGERVMGGVTIPAGEHYPSSEKWGKDGWTYTSFPEAQAKLATLTGLDPSGLQM